MGKLRPDEFQTYEQYKHSRAGPFDRLRRAASQNAVASGLTVHGAMALIDEIRQEIAESRGGRE